MTGVNGITNSVVVDKWAASAVDEDRTLLHLREAIGVNHVPILVGDACVERHEVGLCEQLVESNELDTAVATGLLERIKDEDACAECGHDCRNAGSDSSRSR